MRPELPRRGRGHNGEDLVGGRPAGRELGPENLGVRIRLRAMVDGGSRIVRPHPAASDELGNRTRCVGEDGVSTVHARYGEGVVLADDSVRVLLVVSRQVAVGEVVAGATSGGRRAQQARKSQQGSWGRPM